MSHSTPRQALLHQVAAATYHNENVYATTGDVTPDYFDKFGLLADALLRYDICQEILAGIPREALLIAGMELGGAVLATAVATLSAHSVLVIRKRAPAHGLKRQIEFGDKRALRTVWLVEDVVRTGRSLRYAASLLESHGYNVLGITAVIDREEGAREYLERSGYTYNTLFTATELREAARV